MLLDDGPGDASLQVKHVMHVLGQRSHAGLKVRALGVGHSLKTLLPRGILLVMNRKERDSHRGGVGEVALTQGGECTFTICSTVSSSSTPMTVAIHGSVGLGVSPH
jgi:hypothetical protein